jgi:hypothetical protein
MTADANPRLMKHFDSPFVPLRLFLFYLFAKDLSWLSCFVYHQVSVSGETTRLSIYVPQEGVLLPIIMVRCASSSYVAYVGGTRSLIWQFTCCLIDVCGLCGGLSAMLSCPTDADTSCSISTLHC